MPHGARNRKSVLHDAVDGNAARGFSGKARERPDGCLWGDYHPGVGFLGWHGRDHVPGRTRRSGSTAGSDSQIGYDFPTLIPTPSQG